MMKFSDARKRNIIIKILHCYLDNKKIIDNYFDFNELKTTFYLKESDIKFLNDIFDEKDKRYELKDKYKDKIKDYAKNHNEFKKDRKVIEEEFIKQYQVINEQGSSIRINIDKLNFAIKDAMKNIEKLHWILLPIYSEQIIENVGIIPEEDIYEYYNNYYNIKDIYLELKGNGIDYKSIGGDNNLNKEFSVNIYSSRWGHDDNYTIKRTVDGWHLSFLMYTGNFNKNGEGTFFGALTHDSIFFPKEAVSYALEILWDEADNTNMEIDELKYRFNQIANWINEVEKAAKKYQPEWCNYF